VIEFFNFKEKIHKLSPIIDSPTVNIKIRTAKMIVSGLLSSKLMPIKATSRPRNINSAAIRNVNKFLLSILMQLNNPEKYNVNEKKNRKVILFYYLNPVQLKV